TWARGGAPGPDTRASLSLSPAPTDPTGVYRAVVYDARPPDLSVKLQNATVTLSSGMRVTTGADGGFAFDVPAGMYTASATLTGWDAASTMRTVVAGRRRGDRSVFRGRGRLRTSRPRFQIRRARSAESRSCRRARSS